MTAHTARTRTRTRTLRTRTQAEEGFERACDSIARRDWSKGTRRFSGTVRRRARDAFPFLEILAREMTRFKPKYVRRREGGGGVVVCGRNPASLQPRTSTNLRTSTNPIPPAPTPKPFEGFLDLFFLGLAISPGPLVVWPFASLPMSVTLTGLPVWIPGSNPGNGEILFFNKS